jgi:hypothetical protein
VDGAGASPGAPHGAGVGVLAPAIGNTNVEIAQHERLVNRAQADAVLAGDAGEADGIAVAAVDGGEADGAPASVATVAAAATMDLRIAHSLNITG